MFSVLSRVWDKEKKESNFDSHVFKYVVQTCYYVVRKKLSYEDSHQCKFVFYEHLSNLIEVYAKVA